MAAELITNPSVPHTIEHDLESVCWVLLWVTLLYMKTPWAYNSTTLTEAMNLKVYLSGGGASKLHFIRDPSSTEGLFPDKSPGMYVLIAGIHSIFCKRYHARTQSLHLTEKTRILAMSARKNADVGTDKSADESMDKSTNKCTDGSMHGSTNKSTDEASIATQSGNEVPPSLEALYTTVLNVFEEVLAVENMWSTTDRAERQPVEMPNETKSAAQSGSKRSRDKMEQNFGTTPPASKRLES